MGSPDTKKNHPLHSGRIACLFASMRPVLQSRAGLGGMAGGEPRPAEGVRGEAKRTAVRSRQRANPGFGPRPRNGPGRLAAVGRSISFHPGTG
jgi:hypothetical protein